MSLNEIYFCPSPAVTSKWRRYLGSEYPGTLTTPYQVIFEHQTSAECKYYFETAEDALWFYEEGFLRELDADEHGFNYMACWTEETYVDRAWDHLCSDCQEAIAKRKPCGHLSDHGKNQRKHSSMDSTDLDPGVDREEL
jgi:hypothetical protein